MIAALLGAVATGAFISYWDKKGVATGMPKIRYLFLKTVALIVFVPILFLFYPFEFAFSFLTFALLALTVFTHIFTTVGFVGVVQKTSPHETMLYNTLSIPIVYLIDILISSAPFSLTLFIYLALIILGVLMLSDFKFSQISFKSSLALSVGGKVVKGYLLFFFLKQVSIPVYMLMVYIGAALFLLIFFKNKVLGNTKKDWIWAFQSQSVGTASLALNAILAKSSVSLYMLRIPLILIVLALSSFFVKNAKITIPPTIKNIIAILISIAGIILFGFGTTNF